MTSTSASPAQGPAGAPSAVSATLQPKRWGLPHTLGCWSCLPKSQAVLLCPWQFSGPAWPHSSSPVSSSMPPVVVVVFPWEITLDSTPQPNKRSSPLWQHKDISANI